jgi:hypothetical protein
MNLPGFTAEASLYKESNDHRMRANAYQHNGGGQQTWAFRNTSLRPLSRVLLLCLPNLPRAYVNYSSCCHAIRKVPKWNAG